MVVVNGEMRSYTKEYVKVEMTRPNNRLAMGLMKIRKIRDDTKISNLGN